ncbi:Voltage-gated hydrogen channel 1 [Linum perenne]
MLLRIIVIILLLLDLFFTTLDLSSTILACHHDRRIPLVLAAEWFHWMEIGILSLLSVKLLALLVALGPTVFFRRPGYVIDGVVVVGALVLEGLLEGKGGGLVVVVSLWRVVRVVESAFELSDEAIEAIEAMIEGIVLEFDALKAQNAMLMETIAERDEAIRMLQEMVEKLQGRY